MKTLKSLLITSAIILMSFNLSAQKDYQNLSSHEGIDISYKWKHSKICKKDSPLVLFLKFKNTNEYHASVEFTVDYFWQGARTASSEPNTLCIKSGKTAKGRISKLTFDRAKYSDQDILSENFSLDVSDIQVVKVDRCKKQKK